ncbi:hypothetical protein RJ45_22060 [Photobacterium gaetbulicola]|uniref:Uncharacterized protein n=1 Tax=Photobacterium gaetbulicola TaxID=1295392 RepID=A0A0B9FZE4_9GAMM|nr:hypothetical protein [Photobacterium gaetbulicola]KHT61599.1 hypothetical protein RJ45_22060 [Photobacterium gaetbulicola]
MKLQTLSMYRLKAKAIETRESFTVRNGVDFSILVSTSSSLLNQYYVVESQSLDGTSGKVIPLAHVQVSKVTGVMKFVAFQPENWGISADSDDLVKIISHSISKLETFELL